MEQKNCRLGRKATRLDKEFEYRCEFMDQKNGRLGRKAMGLDKECEYRCESDMQLYK